MRKIRFSDIDKAAPAVMAVGMACFVAAYTITSAWVKDTLLFTGLAAVIASAILYVVSWRKDSM